MEIARKRALESGSDFGVLLGVAAFGPVRGACEAELRWQTFTTLAYGAKALGWFTYLTEHEYGDWNWRDAVINRDGSRTRHYSMLKRLHAQVLNWRPTLMKLTSTGVYRSASPGEPHANPRPVMTRSLEQSTLVESAHGDIYLIGELKNPEKRSCLMVVNRDFNDPVSLQLKLRKADCRNCPNRQVMNRRSPAITLTRVNSTSSLTPATPAFTSSASGALPLCSEL